MNRKCIFCGEKIKNKSLEHVLPQWLIKETGSIKRNAFWGTKLSSYLKCNPEFISFSFNSFKFPACEKCNNEYSKLEGEAKAIVSKILHDQYLNEEEINNFLIWMDKIRVGVWLAFLYLDENSSGITPNYHITQRINLCDSMLVVFKFDDEKKALQLIGANMPCFKSNPICFGIVINNFCFLNISTHFLLSRQLGYPYPRVLKELMKNNEYLIQAMKGTCKINNTPINLDINKPAVYLYQVILKDNFLSLVHNKEDLNYIKNNTIGNNCEVGSIFYKKDKELQKLENKELLLTPNKTVDRDSFYEYIGNKIPSLQKKLILENPYNSSPEMKKNLLNVVLLQNEFICANKIINLINDLE